MCECTQSLADLLCTEGLLLFHEKQKAWEIWCTCTGITRMDGFREDYTNAKQAWYSHVEQKRGGKRNGRYT